MFIYTAKFNRKRAIAIILVLAVILCAIIVIASSTSGKGKANSAQTAATSTVVKNNGQRVKFLQSLGWEVEDDALEEQEVVIPKTFTDVYKEYNELQLTQGFDLSKYGGVEATRYTYRVTNYPGATGEVVADIIVYRGEIIAGNVQSRALDGFMVGLTFPKDAS